MSALLTLLQTHAYREGTFTLASGRTSDFFIDCKSAVLRADGHRLVGEAMLAAIGRLSKAPDAVAGVALGGCSLASAVSLTSALSGERSLDAVYVRKQVKDHGTAQLLEGAAHLAQGSRLVLLEDTVTTGGSSLRALAPLREAGFLVDDVVALVDREEGAAAAFAEAKVGFWPLFRRRDFLPAQAQGSE